MKNCEQFLPDLCAWIDGELEDSRALEAHLAECASCRALVEQYRQIDAMLAQTEPPPELHERIMQGLTVNHSPKAKRRFAFGSATAVAAVAAVLLLAIGMGWIRAPQLKSAEAPAAAPAAADFDDETVMCAEPSEPALYAAAVESATETCAEESAEAPAAEMPAAFAAAPKMTAAKPQAEAEPTEDRECADASAENVVVFDAGGSSADAAYTSEECGAPMKAVMQSAEADNVTVCSISCFWLLSDSTPDTLPDDFASLQFVWGEAGIAGYPVWSAQTDADTFRQLLDACGDLPGRVIGDGEPYRIILLPPDSSQVRLIWRIHADTAQLPAEMQACLTFETGKDSILRAEIDQVTLWALYLSYQDTLDGEIWQIAGSNGGAQIALES